MAEPERPLKTFAEIDAEQAAIRRCSFALITQPLRNHEARLTYDNETGLHRVYLECRVVRGESPLVWKEQTTVFTSSNSIEAKYALREAQDSIAAAKRLHASKIPVGNSVF
jgi:hypothetical protein